MNGPGDTQRGGEAHRFIVTAVEAAEAEGSIAAKLTDARGGRVVLQLDETCAKLLRDLLDEQLP